MILVDTSILVDYLRSPSVQVREVLLKYGAAVCGITRAELLCGVRSDVDATRINEALDRFTNLEVTEAVWQILGENLRLLRSKGIVVPFQDALIATLAMMYGIPVWTRDEHYRLMQNAIPTLSLFEPTT
ncbi:MAG: PIN domain-containing protein [Planctomycetes bacterium]|nr:PIN domain-containing protein [Planctomycetota bacterium]